jgi:hypothetical protein
MDNPRRSVERILPFMRVIDSHVHLYPPEVNRDPAAWASEHREVHWAQLCTRRRADGRPVQAFPSVDDLLRTLDAAGIGRAVLLGWYWENHDTAVAQNRFYAATVRRHPDRFSAFAALAPQAGAAALAELRRAREDGLVGVGELNPYAVGLRADSPELAAVLELAGDLGLPVNLHVTDPDSAPFPGRVETPLSEIEALVRRHARTRFVLAHWAGGLDVRGLDNVWVDTAAAPLIYRRPVWSWLGERARPDQVLLGSDHPLHLYPKRGDEAGPGAFVDEVAAALPEEAVRAAVLADNARRLFGL